MQNDEAQTDFIRSEFFSNRVKDLLDERGLDQKWLAMRMGVTPAAISIMLSRNNPKLFTVLQLAREFDLPVEQFLAGYEDYI